MPVYVTVTHHHNPHSHVLQDGKHLVLVEEFAPQGDLHTLHRSLDGRMSESDLIQLVLMPFLVRVGRSAVWGLTCCGTQYLVL